MLRWPEGSQCFIENSHPFFGSAQFVRLDYFQFVDCKRPKEFANLTNWALPARHLANLVATVAARLNKELESGLRHLQTDDYGVAIDWFSRIIQFNPAYGGAWKKGAAAYYLRGEYRASLDDIAETLRRTPRHFGALWRQAAMF